MCFWQLTSVTSVIYLTGGGQVKHGGEMGLKFHHRKHSVNGRCQGDVPFNLTLVYVMILGYIKLSLPNYVRNYGGLLHM